jgi:hypothetical protein
MSDEVIFHSVRAPSLTGVVLLGDCTGSSTRLETQGIVHIITVVDSLASLEDVRRDLLVILAEAVHDLNADKLSEESFNSFRSIMQIAMDRRAFLRTASPAV